MSARSKKTLPEFGAFFPALRGETDRAAAVLGAAYIDASLERLIRARMIERPPDWLLKPDGPLGSFGARIAVVHALGWIPEWLREDLKRVRDIRNEFAHAADHALTFESDPVRAMAYALSPKERIEAMITQMSSTHADPVLAASMAENMRAKLLGSARKRFELAVVEAEVYLGNLTRRSQHAPENLSAWTFFNFSTDASIGPDDPIPLPRRD